MELKYFSQNPKLVIINPGMGLMDAPVKPIPLISTGTTAPGAAEDGVMDVRIGPAGAMDSVTGLLVPPEVCTVRVVGPSVALAAVVKEAVICVELVTFMLLTASPSGVE